MVVLKVENNTTTEWPESRATNCSEFTQTIGMAASPFLVLVSLLRSRQRLSLLALAHVKVLLLACSCQGFSILLGPRTKLFVQNTKRSWC